MDSRSASCSPMCSMMSSMASSYVIFESEAILRTLGTCLFFTPMGPPGFLAWMLDRGPVGTLMPGGSPGGAREPCTGRDFELLESMAAVCNSDLVGFCEVACS